MLLVSAPNGDSQCYDVYTQNIHQDNDSLKKKSLSMDERRLYSLKKNFN
jgi:hypothetical protein